MRQPYSYKGMAEHSRIYGVDTFEDVTPKRFITKEDPGAPDDYESLHTQFTAKTILDAFEVSNSLTNLDIERHLKGKVLGKDCIYDSLAVLVDEGKIKVKKSGGTNFYSRA